jgi:hypothetical protein
LAFVFETANSTLFELAKVVFCVKVEPSVELKTLPPPLPPIPGVVIVPIHNLLSAEISKSLGI